MASQITQTPERISNVPFVPGPIPPLRGVPTKQDVESMADDLKAFRTRMQQQWLKLPPMKLPADARWDYPPDSGNNYPYPVVS